MNTKKIRNFLRRIFARKYIDLGRIQQLKNGGITPLFSFSKKLQGGSNDQSKMSEMQKNKMFNKALKNRKSSATIQIDLPGMS